jgi:hypothetical protein
MTEPAFWVLALGLIWLVYVAVAQVRALSGYAFKLSVFVLIASAVALGWCGYIASRTLLPVTFPDHEPPHAVHVFVGTFIAWGVLLFPSIVHRLTWFPRESGFSIAAALRAVQLWKRRSLDEMLVVVARCGIILRASDPSAPVSASLLWPPQSAERRRIKKGGFETLLIAMSDHSDDVWHFDSETIYDHGDYKAIVDNLCRLSKGALAFEAVNDFVDVAKGIAWLDLVRWEDRAHRPVPGPGQYPTGTAIKAAG